MHKLTRHDILGPAAYHASRDELRRQVIALKRLRRVEVGPSVSLVFENRVTVRFQVEEMCRAEGLSTDEKIAEEVEVYNKLLPEDGQLAATLFIEITTPGAIERTLDRLVGLQHHVWLVIGGHRIRATFDAGQFEADKLAAVQYLSFPLDPEARAALTTPGTAVAVSVDHPSYRHDARLSEAQRAELATDLG